MNYKELMSIAYGEEGEDNYSSPLSPKKGMPLPDAHDFFQHLESMFGKPANYLFTSDVQYIYQDTEGYGWNAWGALYLAIPEYDIYERHDGKWASVETLIEAVKETKHTAWRHEDELRETKRDIDNFLEKR